MRLWVGAFALLMALATFGPTASGAAAQAVPTPTPIPEPQQVVSAFEMARGTGDVEGALAQFSDTAVVILQGQTSSTYEGKDQVRKYLQTLGGRFQTVMRSHALVEGNRVTWTERDQFGDQAIDATVVAVISTGRIVSLTYRDNAPISPRATAAVGQRVIDIPSFAWPAALALVGIGLIGLVFGRPRRKASQSQLDGRLLVALRRSRAPDIQDEKKAA